MTDAGLGPQTPTSESGPPAWKRPRPVAVRAAEVKASRCRAVGPHFVIAPERNGQDDALLAALAAVRHDASAVVVLAAAPDAATVLSEQVRELALTALARGADCLLLAASGLASAAPNGKRAASRVAEQAGLTVVAPAGAVAVRPDGTLRVDAIGQEEPGWWRCPPSGSPRFLGPIWPTPVSDGPEIQEPIRPVPALKVEQLPAGLWVQASNAPASSPPEVFAQVTTVPGTTVVILGAPMEPDLDRAAVLEVLRPVSTETDLLLSAPWSNIETLRTLMAAAASMRGRPVRAAIGLPMNTPSGHSARLLDDASLPSWEPLLTELTAMPDVRRIVASRWRTASEVHAQSARAPLPMAGGWEIELVPAGVWIRPAGRPADCAPRLLKPNWRRLAVIVGGETTQVPVNIWDSLPEILAALPITDAVPLHLVAHGPVDEDTLEEASALARLEGWTFDGASPDFADSDEPTSSAVQARPPLHRPVVDVPLPDTAPNTLTAAHLDMPVGRPLEPRAESPGPDAPGPVQPPSPASHSRAGTPVVGQPRVITADKAARPPLVSTQADREAFQALLGEHFGPLLNRAQLVATRLPGLRHMGSGPEDRRADLVAVLSFALDIGTPATRAQLSEAARSGAPGPLGPFLHCLASGLGILPSHQGIVLLGAHVQERELDQYEPGRLLVEPGPLTGLSAGDVQLGGSVEFAVWSTTGRRTSLIVASGGEQEVVFAPGTRFTVIDKVPSQDPDQPARVLLREVDSSSAPAAAREANVRARLAAWLDERVRVSLPGLRRPDHAERYLLTPGVMIDRHAAA